jgi:hypothetical protein
MVRSTVTDAAAPANPRTAYRIILVHGLSSFCYGLVFPYTGIYLSGIPEIGTGGVALYYATSGTANLVVALVLAAGWVRPPRVGLAVLGNLMSCTGYLILAMVHSLTLVGVAAAANGMGQGCFMAAIIPIINSLVSEGDRRQVFARRYQVLNATLAAGTLVAGLITALLSERVIHSLILVNAAGYLPIAAILVRYRTTAAASERARSEQQAEAGTPGSSLTALLKAAAAVILFQLGVYLFGFSQFEATMPLVTDKLMHAGLGWISIVIAINVVVIVVMQSRITRLLERRTEQFGLRAAVTLWSGGYLLVGLTMFAPSPVRFTGLALYSVLFALGECAYSCSYHPWLISRVPEEALTRANALSNSTMGIGMFLGPTIGVGLLSSGSAALVWLALGVLCASVGLTTVRLSLRRWRYAGRHQSKSLGPARVPRQHQIPRQQQEEGSSTPASWERYGWVDQPTDPLGFRAVPSR